MAGRHLVLGAAAGWLLTVSVWAGPSAPRQAPAAPQLAAPAAEDLFQTADQCMACHNGLIAPGGEDVSIGASWRASMMANSARDPYWQAAVRREVMDHPEAAAEIEDECSICHMPMATFAARQVGGHGRVFDLVPGTGSDSPEARLAADGVSCTACHQITAARLGSAESFNGGYVIDASTASPGQAIPPGRPIPPNARRIFGPFEIDPGRSAVMHSASGFQPAEGRHLQSSELCATCHTLITTALGARGAAVGRLPEQMPYLEWQASAFRSTRTCQDCHMPAVDAEMPIARVLGQPRAVLSRHEFLGGNFFMMRMLNRFRDELGVTATPAEMSAGIERTLRHLQTDTARVSVTPPISGGGRVTFDVIVENLAGHKFPTAYPSRRAWLHVIVRDAAGRIVFESGALEPNGRVTGNDNDRDGTRFEPHHLEIASADDVQIYEAVLAGPDGRLTTGLLTATRYVKDNRLLPAGFDKARAPADVAVHGAAATDADFGAASDRVRYVVDRDDASGLRVEVALLFQPIGFRWAENLRSYDAPETRRFVRYFEVMASASAAVVAQASASASSVIGTR